MPTMDGYEYADKPHDKTVIDKSYRYGCFNRNQNGSKDIENPNGWNEDGTRRMIKRKTNWLPEVRCGHDDRANDPHCEGCCNV